jgi:hypothetical protein
VEWRRLDAPADWHTDRYAILERQNDQRSRLYIQHFDWRDYGHYQCVGNIEGAFGIETNKLLIDVLFTPDHAERYEPNALDPFDDILFPKLNDADYELGGPNDIPGSIITPGFVLADPDRLNGGGVTDTFLTTEGDEEHDGKY